MRLILILMILFHGFIHLMGFAKAFNYFAIPQLSQPISRFTGILWLVCFALFFYAATMFFIHNDFWWIAALLALLLSQALIIKSWQDARFGTIANLLIAIPVVLSLINVLPGSFKHTYKTAVQKRLLLPHPNQLLTPADISHLPLPVQKYLYFTGSVGKPVIYNFRGVFNGKMKRDRNGKWMSIQAQQYNFYGQPARLFYIESSMFGIPFDGLHSFTGGKATMQIKLAHVLKVADASGEKMNQSETVTLLNDMCLLAPATLIDKNIQWETIDSFTVKARFNNQGISISALLHFDSTGALVNFTSDDRFLSADGKQYVKYRWTTPVRAYQDVDGRKVCSNADALWHMPEGEFNYANYILEEIEYNCSAFTFI